MTGAARDEHRHTSRLSDVILGGQDGLVNVLGVILGVAAATHDTRLVLLAGLSATFAESVSMGAVAFTSRQAEQARYESERAREHRHIRAAPEAERSEVYDIYRAKGFDGPLLDRIVDTITADPEVWVAVMMAEELRLSPIEPSGALRAAALVGLSALVGSLIPLAPYAFLPVAGATWVALALAAVTLFAVGAYKGATTVGDWLRSGLEMSTIGLVAALVGYLVGVLFKIT